MHNFNPRSSCEERRYRRVLCRCDCDFNPRSSCEERPAQRHDSQRAGTNFNPRSSCEERLLTPCAHPSRRYFNPRSSCEERPTALLVCPSFPLFQSTLLMRGATLAPSTCRRYADHFNPRSSCEERPAAPASRPPARDISIHAPHARSDRRFHQLLIRAISISIHAPHARSDRASCRSARRGRHFNPRSSCEERLMPSYSKFQTILFQSTLLMRGATQKFELGYFDTLISIHAPHARSDRRSRWLTTSQSAFQSTLLMRGATYALTVRAPGEQISIHAPHARSDAAARDRNAVLHISIHAPHARSDMMSTRSARTSSNFNPRSSCEERPDWD